MNEAVHRSASKERYTMIHPDFLAALARGEPDRRLKSRIVRGGNEWIIIAAHSSPAG